MASSSPLLVAVLLMSAAPVWAQASSPSDTVQAKSAARNEGQRVEIPGEEQRVLVGSFFAPKDSKVAAPAALLVHDADGQRSDLYEFAEKLQKQGFAVLVLDLRGHGESTGSDTPWAKLSDDEKIKVWSATVRDLKFGADWLGKHDGVQRANVSMLGDRAGCALVARRAVSDENVRSIVLLDPQAEQLGFNVTKDIQQLRGVPTYIAVTKEAQPKAEVIAASSEKANDGMKYVEVAVFKGVALSPCVDKRLPSDISKFMFAKAVPKKTDK